jgi:asparagine synthase (glutamine-hydrolysing)
MSPRYLLVAGENIAERAALMGRIAERTGLPLAFANGRIAAFADRSCRCLAVGNVGCILGTLFARDGPAREVPTLTVHDVQAIARSRGQALIERFWGGYVAALDDARTVRILRDPSGDFPCYFVRHGTFTTLAADAELLVASEAVRVDIDFEEIGRQLFRAFVPVRSTALTNIHELLAGFALYGPSQSQQQEPCWDPWDHAEPASGDRSMTVDRLSQTVRHAIGALASPHRRLLLSVSGGLDSSIVGACLASAAADTVCLTMFADDPAGDERPFARALCNKFGLELIERPYRLEDIDLGEAMAANLPRPKDRLQALAFERVHYAVAAEIGASAFVTGNGGDHVFGYSQSAAPIADRYLAHGLGRGVLESLGDVCRQTGCSISDAIRQAWAIARSSPDYRVRPNRLFLGADFLSGLGSGDWHHPWLDAPPGALPGKAAHIATILRVQPNLEPSLGGNYPVINPLVSQPVVEACLRIPSWEWRAGGRDRSLARSAFSKDLPAIVLDRRVKGTPGRFAARVLDHFRASIRERLLDGRLASAGIADKAGLDRILAGDRPVPDLERVRILELVNVEAWIDHWTARRAAGMAGHQIG